MKSILNKVIELTKIESEKISKNVIQGIEIDLTDNVGWWQVEHTINELIDSIEIDLLNDGTISDDDNLKDIIDNSDENIRSQMFNILVNPIVSHFKNKNYDVEVNKHFEEIKVSNR